MGRKRKNEEREPRLRPETKKSVWAIAFLGIAVILILAGFQFAGPVGKMIFEGLSFLFGWGYAVLPISLVLTAGSLLIASEERRGIVGISILGAVILIFSILALIELVLPGHGGLAGLALGSLRVPLGAPTAIIVNVFVAMIALLITIDVPIKIRWPIIKKSEEAADKDGEAVITGESEEDDENEDDDDEDEEESDDKEEPEEITVKAKKSILAKPSFKIENYVAPPLSLLKSSIEKPTTGDLRANANIIKRTLESFGIAVEMGEINIGPKVTRYTLKPAEGIKLSRIVALNQDLALALAAHPIRIEAPIPGKSLVGIEVPNKAAALVRLGSLMAYPEFQKSGLLGFIIGRDVTGEPIFADIEKMPHLLVAGATGSGKSVTIHSLIISLLYKNSPATLRMILVDPKRVELSIYENIPHLISPVITESKKAAAVFRWAIMEMERRYDLLLKAGCRDIKGYNSNGGADNPLPYLLIVVDELADLMTSYGREVEGSIVRLAQMARATGLHLVLSTQRPSVEVITGLIKANITSRIALQVASQVDSRTILDTNGAEKLLGGGDLLLISSELSKPKRIQGSYISEEEIHSVADFVRENNEQSEAEEEVDFAKNGSQSAVDLDDYSEENEDELYDEAVNVIREAQKASASLLQRRLKVGYARAARLLDIMEENGIIGPGDGAKAREVFIEKTRES